MKQAKSSIRIGGTLAVVASLATTAAGQMPRVLWSEPASCPKSLRQFKTEFRAYERKVVAHFEALDAGVLQDLHDRRSGDAQSQALRLFAPHLIPRRNAFDTRCWTLLHDVQTALESGHSAGPEMQGWLSCLAHMAGGEQGLPPLAQAVHRCHSRLISR